MKLDSVFVFFINLLLLFACYTDLRWRKITNYTTLAVLIISFLSVFYRSDDVPFFLLFFIFIFGVFFSMKGVIGAGDVKLICALSLGLSATQISNFLLLTGMSGIPLSLLTLLYYRCLLKSNDITIPYGIAICCGYWMTLII